LANKPGNPKIAELNLKVTDGFFMNSIRKGNVTQKAISIDLNLVPSAVRKRLDRLIKEGKVKKLSSAITYGVIDEELRS
jgi:predicted transcriptional regulator